MNVIVERLTALRDYLATIDPHEFDMREYREPAKCGTHMCVAGHMASMPIFQALGYELVAVKLRDHEIYYPHIVGTGNKEEAEVGVSGRDAIHRVLPLDYADIEYLFYEWDGMRAHGQEALDMKLAQIDRLIAQYNKETD